ncbi:MAG: phosphoglycerate kinase [Sphaerochaetaceae bacterium]
MNLISVKDVDLKDKRVLVRVDFNVPLKDNVVTDDTRIKRALPTIEYILGQKGTRIIMMSHLGRPKGKKDPTFSMAPVAKRLSELLNKPVTLATDVVGEEVEQQVASLQEGEILLLENTRFYKEEEANDPSFSKQLAALGDIYINDAFGAAHRAHASTEGVTHYLESAAGLLVEKEIAFFAPLLENPKKPFVAIIGGAKVSSKITVLESLAKRCDAIVIGGAMAYTFLYVQGHNIGKSMVEKEYIDTANSFLQEAKELDVRIILPVDHVGALEFSETSTPVAVDTVDIPDNLIGLDIGPKTEALIANELKDAQSIVWNGPMGVFEFASFSHGTQEVAKMVASSKGISVVGGGDSVAAVNQFGYDKDIDHVSTGGGASLEFLEGRQLPGITPLERK